MAITAEQRDQILKIVAGLFNGAPGGAFLSDFAAAVEAGVSMQDLARALAATNEFRHGIMGGKVTVEQQVAVLMNHFGVVADDVEGSAASLAEAYFTDSINAGIDFGDIVYTAVVFLENDTSEEFAPYKALLANKALVAALHAENTVNIASVAEGQSIFAGVTSDGPSTPEEAVEYLNGLVPGQTFTLTTGQDEIVGTVNKDIINGNDTTLTAFDSIDGGGASNDTLNLSFAGNVTAIPVGVTVKNVENVNITAGGDVTADLSGWSGVHNLNVTGITAGKNINITSAAAKQATLSGKNNVTFTDATVESVNVTAGNDATVTADAATSIDVTADKNATVTADAATSVNVTAGKDVTITAAAATDISVSDAAGAGGVVITADVLENLALNNVTADTTITTSSTTLALHVDGTISKVTDADGTVTDLAVVVNSDYELDLDFAEATTLAVSGAAVLSMTSISDLGKLETLTVNEDAGLTADLSALGALETIDASATTGVIDVEIAATATSVKTGSGDDIITQVAALSATQSISTGAGNDIVHLSDTPTAGATVDGGDGEDTLELEDIDDLSALDTAALEDVTNFEILGLSGNFGSTNGTLDLSALGSSFTGVRLNGTADDDITLDKAGAATSLTILQAPGKNVAVTLKTDGSSDSLALTIGDDTSTELNLAANTITAAGQDSLAVTANGEDSDKQHTLKLAAVDATSLTITGTAGVDFTGSTFTKLTTVTSDAEGDIKIALSTADDSTVTTGAGDDTITTGDGNDTIDAGDGDNTIDAGDGDNTITTGAGDDDITVGDGDNTIDAGDGDNIIVAGDGDNTITTGAGDDDITVGNGDNTIDAGDGDNTIVAGDGDNTITTGAGDDIITLGTGVNTITTGAGSDKVVVAVPLNGNSYSTITDAQSGDQLEFGTLTAFTTAKVSLASTAAFQDYLDAVVAANGADKGGWFQFGGDTFVVVDADANSTTFQNNEDIVIRLQGQVDLSTATLDSNMLTIG